MGKIETLCLFIMIDVYTYIFFAGMLFQDYYWNVFRYNFIPVMIVTYLIIIILFSIKKTSKALSYPVVRMLFAFLLLLSRVIVYFFVQALLFH